MVGNVFYPTYNIRSDITSSNYRLVDYTLCYVKLFLTVLALLILFCFSVNAEILSCKDKSGKTIFTDISSHCAVSDQDNITEINVKNHCGKKVVNKHKVDYCTPRREYYKTGNDWAIYLEQTLVDADKSYADKALNKLERSLNEIIAKLPANAARQLKKLDIYLMKGEKSSVDEGGMSYIRPGEPRNYYYLDPGWQHAIVIYSAKTFMYLDEVWAKKALMHELAHAWHISNWPQRHPPIYNTYLNAKDNDLYRNVDDYKGRKIETAYALKNQMEYFAELSAMYFVGGNYYPYSVKDLKHYDPLGFQMLETLWGI